MKNFKAITFTLFTFCTLLIACNNGEADKGPKEIAKENNEKFDKKGEKDADALIEAYLAGKFEIAVTDTTKEKLTHPEAKSVAKMIIDAHTSLNNQIKSLADKKSISLPADITEEQKKEIAFIQKNSPKNYDEPYIDWLIADHKKAINMYEKYAEKCTDTDIKSWFSMGLAEIRKHYDMLLASEKIIDKK